jgi:threonine dehydrogenase-like Zn-dependent dehydrogenase
VLTIGCGTIGMGVIAAAVRKGATVIAADIAPTKLETARRFGAQYTLCTDHDILPELRALTDDEGVSVAIEAVGRPETYQLAVAAACYAGRVVTIGYAKEPVSFDTSQFVRKELDIRGSRNALLVFPAVIQMLERRAQPFESLVTRIYPLAETPQAFADWHAAPGDVNKLLVNVKA